MNLLFLLFFTGLLITALSFQESFADTPSVITKEISPYHISNDETVTDLTIESEGELVIDNNKTLVVDGKLINEGKISLNGILQINEDGELDSKSLIEITRSGILVNNGGIVNFSDGGITDSEGYSIKNIGGKIHNEKGEMNFVNGKFQNWTGDIVNEGGSMRISGSELKLWTKSELRNEKGSMVIDIGISETDSQITNNDKMELLTNSDNRGDVKIVNSGNLINSGTIKANYFENTGEITNEGRISLHSSAIMKNEGKMDNTGILRITGTNTGEIISNNTLELFGVFTNNGLVEIGGMIKSDEGTVFTGNGTICKFSGSVNESNFDFTLELCNIATTPSKITVINHTYEESTINLSWDAPDDGGNPITDYVIEYREKGDSKWIQTSEGESTLTQVSVPDLEKNTEYEFTISSVNENGNSEKSDPIVGMIDTKPDTFTVSSTQTSYKVDMTKSFTIEISGEISPLEDQEFVSLSVNGPDGYSGQESARISDDGKFEKEIGFGNKTPEGEFYIVATYNNHEVKSSNFRIENTIEPETKTTEPETKTTEPETKTTEPETKTTEPETTSQKSKELGIAGFVNSTLAPQYYVDRYNTEPTYKEWFDENYPEYDSIYQAVGLEESVGESKIDSDTGYIEEPKPDCGRGTEVKNGICVIIQNPENPTLSPKSIESISYELLAIIFIPLIIVGLLVIQYIRKDTPFRRFNGKIEDY